MLSEVKQIAINHPPIRLRMRRTLTVLDTRKYVLAIDQGTTSTKTLVIDQDGAIIGTSWPERFGIEPSYPQPGWVEFDPDCMLDTVRSAEAAVRTAGIRFAEIAGVGLANQGETVIAFDGASGRPICPAISWQDRRTEHTRIFHDAAAAAARRLSGNADGTSRNYRFGSDRVLGGGQVKVGGISPSAHDRSKVWSRSWTVGAVLLRQVESARFAYSGRCDHDPG